MSLLRKQFGICRFWFDMSVNLFVKASAGTTEDARCYGRVTKT